MTARLDGLRRPGGRGSTRSCVDQFGLLIDGTGAYDGAPAALGAAGQIGQADRSCCRIRASARARTRAASGGRSGGGWASIRTASSPSCRRARCARAAAGPAGARPAGPAQDPAAGARRRHPRRSTVSTCRLTDDGAQADLVLLAASRGEEIGLDAYEAAARPRGGAPGALPVHQSRQDHADRPRPRLRRRPDRPTSTPRWAAPVAADRQAVPGDLRPPPWRRWATPIRLGWYARDSPDHDVRGGRDAGLAPPRWCAPASHAGLADDALAALCRRSGAVPDFILPRFDFAPAAAPAEVQTER